MDLDIVIIYFYFGNDRCDHMFEKFKVYNDEQLAALYEKSFSEHRRFNSEKDFSVYKRTIAIKEARCERDKLQISNDTVIIIAIFTLWNAYVLDKGDFVGWSFIAIVFSVCVCLGKNRYINVFLEDFINSKSAKDAFDDFTN